MSVILYHVDDEIVHDVINSKLYSVPPREPIEFSSTFIGRKFMEHKHFHGIVEVKVIRSRTGIEFDLDDAERRATELLHHAEMQGINQYLESQHTDRLEHGKPPVRASGRYAKLIRKHKVNLQDYGINPIGTLDGNLAVGKDPQMMQMQTAIVNMQNLLMSVIAAGGITPANAEQLKAAMGTPLKPANPAPQTKVYMEVPDEPPVEASLGDATEGTESLPGGDDGIIDLSRSMSHLGVMPGSEEDPNTIPGAKIEGRGNLSRDQVSNVINQIARPARKGKTE